MRTRMRAAAAFTATIVGCAVGVIGSVGAASAAASTQALESGVKLPFAKASAMIVDTKTGYIFVSGGAGSTYIEVLNLSGQIVGQITENGATGLALSADGGTLYAADAPADSIAVIDAATLMQTSSYPVGAVPQYLALSGGNLWFSTAGDLFVHEVALSTGAVSQTSGEAGYYGAQLTASAAAPSMLVVATTSISPATINVFNVASGAPVQVASGGGDCENLGLGGMAITPDGKSIDLACGYPYEGIQLTLAGMSTVQQTYNTGAYPSAVAVAADGETLVGVNGQADTVEEFGATDSTATGTFATGDVNEPAFLSWGADDSLLYSIVQGYDPYASFRTYHLVASLDVTLSVPAAAFPSSTFTVTGRVTENGAPLAGQQVTVTRLASGSTTTMGTFSTDANGDFSFKDSNPALLTSATYTASVVGATPAVTASGTITTVPVKYPISKPPVRTPVKAVGSAVRR